MYSDKTEVVKCVENSLVFKWRRMCHDVSQNDFTLVKMSGITLIVVMVYHIKFGCVACVTYSVLPTVAVNPVCVTK